MPTLDPLERLLDSRSAGALLDIGPAKLALWRQRQMGPPYIKLEGGAVRYRLRDLNDWIRTLRNHFRPDPAWKGIGWKDIDHLLDMLEKRDAYEKRDPYT